MHNLCGLFENKRRVWLARSQPVQRVRWVAYVALLLVAGCSRQKPYTLIQYVEPRGIFSIKVPDKPVYTGGKSWNFFADQRATAPLVTVAIEPLIGSQLNTPIERLLDQEANAYGFRGEVISVKPVSMDSFPGREVDVTAGPYAPLRLRVYLAHDKEYWIKWNPNIPRATESADTFVIY